MEALLKNPIQQKLINKQKILAVIGVFVPILGFFLMKFAKHFIQILDFQNPIIKILFSFFLVWVVLSLTIVYNYFVEKQPFLLFKESKKPWKFYLISFVSILILLAIVSMSASSLLNYLGFSSHHKPSLTDTYFKLYPSLIFVASITAGVCEELIFRGYLLPRLANIFYNKYVAIILSSALFGFAHFGYGSVVQIVNPFLIGLVFAFTYFRYRNLKLLIFLHIIWDMVVIYFFS